MEIINVKSFGAKGDGTTDDTIAVSKAISYMKSVNAKFIYFPSSEGSYCVNYNLDYRLYRGEGSITFLGMVIQNFPSHPQGKDILISDIQDEIINCMQIPNEPGVVEKIDPRKKNCGSWQLDDFSFKSYKFSERERLTTWGVVRISDPEKIPDECTFMISNMSTFVYRKSTKQWELLGLSQIDGGFWADGNNYIGNLPITKDNLGNGYIKYTKEQRDKGLGLHFWGDVVPITVNDYCNWDDIKYVVSTYDIMIISDKDTEGAFFSYSGCDSKHHDSVSNNLNNFNSILEMCSGRGKFVHKYPTRLYSTTLDYKDKTLCSQELIDNMILQSCINNKVVIGHKFDFNTIKLPGVYKVAVYNSLASNGPRGGNNVGLLRVSRSYNYIIQEFIEDSTTCVHKFTRMLDTNRSKWTGWGIEAVATGKTSLGGYCNKNDLDGCANLINKIAQGLVDIGIMKW